MSVIKFIIKHLLGAEILGVIAFIGVLFMVLLFLLLRKIRDYYKENRRNHGKKRK